LPGDSGRASAAFEISLRASFDRPQGYSRVDVMLPEQGEPSVLELNTIPA
jgi:D-alanine-D-alanine ligase-like ATP-grasp enzyme